MVRKHKTLLLHTDVQCSSPGGPLCALVEVKSKIAHLFQGTTCLNKRVFSRQTIVIRTFEFVKHLLKKNPKWTCFQGQYLLTMLKFQFQVKIKIWKPCDCILELDFSKLTDFSVKITGDINAYFYVDNEMSTFVRSS